MNAKTLLTLGFAAVSAAASAANIEICKYGGTNAPYTVENPLVCDGNFSYIGAWSGTGGTIKPDSLASFTSGEHWISGTFYASGPCSKYSKTAELVISGPDTVVTANSISFTNIGRDADDYNATVDADHPFTSVISITDGAKLVSSNGLMVTPSKWFHQYLYLDHATVECLNGQLRYDQSDTPLTSYLYAQDSTISAPKEDLKFGRNDGYGGPSSQQVHCTNVTFNVTGLNFQYNGLTGEFVDCDFPSDGTTTYNFLVNACANGDSVGRSVLDVTFKNCTMPHADAGSSGWGYAGSLGRLPHITFDGGTYHFERLSICGGGSGNHAAWLTLTNDVKITLGFDSFTVGDSSTGRLDIAGTKLVVTNHLYLGKSAGHYKTADSLKTAGILNIYDGADLRIWNTVSWGDGAGTLDVGCCAPGIVNMYGGTLAVRSIGIGANIYTAYDMSASPNVFYQAGGVVDNAKGDTYGGTVIAQQNTSQGKLILDGGRFVTVAIRGGAGTSTFLANGGTVVAGMNNPNWGFFNGITTAKVGPKGLTMEVPDKRKGIAINQAMSNQDGGEGLFTKTGAGTLTFSTADAGWTVTRTVVSDGTLQIANATMALTGTELVTTNSGVLSVKGDSSTDGMTVANLKLSGGAIALDDGEVIQVTDGFSATAATGVQLTTPPTLEDKTGVKVITVAAGVTISPETKSALAKPSKTGRTTAKGKPIFGYLDVRAGANGTQEIWYTERRFRQGLMVVVR